MFVSCKTLWQHVGVGADNGLVRVAVRNPSPLPAIALESVPSRAPTARVDSGDQGFTGSARRLFALRGPLSTDDVKLLESNAAWLSGRQIERLSTRTDAKAKSARFAALAENHRTVEELTRRYWDPKADDRIRLAVPELAKSGALTPTMVAKLAAVLLVGPVTRHFAITLDWQKLDLSGIFDKNSPLWSTDLDALRGLMSFVRGVPSGGREKFLRATAYELEKIDQELVARLIEQVGLEELTSISPSLLGLSEQELPRELTRLDGLKSYLATQRVCEPIKATTLSPEVRAKIAVARIALENADAYAEENSVTLGSPPETLETARKLYSEAAERFRRVVALDPSAISNPDVKLWITRRQRSLFVSGAAGEVESGATAGKVTRLVKGVLSRVPGVSRLVAKPGLAEEKLLEQLTRRLGFDPGRKLAPNDRAKLFAELEASLFAGPCASDPLTAIDLPAEVPSLHHVHVLFAPGVVPIAGVFDDTFESLESTLGVRSEIAKTGFFCSEEDNARDVRGALERIIKKDPNARVLMVGYSQGAVNSLALLDQLRTGSDEDRALADHVVAMASLYGAHNGSTAAEDGVEIVKSVLGRFSGGKAAEYALSGAAGLGTILAGGVDSLKRSTRAKFWQTANLPSQIPYLSITAVSEPCEVPMVLKKGYADMKLAAEARGLPTDNDTQVLRFDAQLGNDDSVMGRAVRRNTVNLEVRGHHWNPLRARDMGWDDAELYAFPKRPQLESPLLVLAEMGLVG